MPDNFEQFAPQIKALLEDNHVRHTSCSVYVSCHNVHPLYPGNLGGFGKHDISKSVIGISFEESFTGCKATITMVPRFPYWEMFFPNDSISIYFATNAKSPAGFGVIGQVDKKEDNDRVLVGYIDSCRRTTQINRGNGARQIRVSLTVSGIHKAFQSTQVYYNEALGPDTMFGAMMPGLATLTKNVPLSGTPVTIPRAIALTYLGYARQFSLPENYPIGAPPNPAEPQAAYNTGNIAADAIRHAVGDVEFSPKDPLKQSLKSFLNLAYEIEQELGIHNVRLNQAGFQRQSLVQNIAKKNKDNVPSDSILLLVDLFTRTENNFVDGIVYNTPTTDLTGSVWNMMRENSNPNMNEMFITMAPGKDSVFQKEVDEWGQSPAYIPTLVIREKPFSTTDNQFEVPTRNPGGKRRINYGNIFFSNKFAPAEVPLLQNPTRQGIGSRGSDPSQARRLVAAIQKNFDSRFASRAMQVLHDGDTNNRNYKEKLDVEFLSIQSTYLKGILDKDFIEDALTGDDGGDARKFYFDSLDPKQKKEIEAMAVKLLELFILIQEYPNALPYPTVPTVGDNSGAVLGERYIDRIQIRPQDIMNETLGTSDNDTYNMWTISQSAVPLIPDLQRFVLLEDGLMPLFLRESIERHGLRIQEMTTKFMHTGGAAQDSTAAFDFLIRSLIAQDIWYQHNPYYLCGAFTIPGMPKARVGMALDVGGDRQESFYVEGVSHEWSFPGIMTTTLSVTRGQPSGFTDVKQRFHYAAPHATNIFSSDGKTPISRTNAKEQPVLTRTVSIADWRDENQLLARVIAVDPKELSQRRDEILKTIRDAGKMQRDVFDYLLDEGWFLTKAEAEKVRNIRQKVKIPSGISIKEDRARSGRPPWIDQPDTLGAMWDPIKRGKYTGDNFLPRVSAIVKHTTNKK